MKKLSPTAFAGAALAVASIGAAHAADVTLRYSHFWPADSRVHTEVFEAWAEAVEAASDGRIRVRVYPAQALSRADGSYQATVNGVADVVSTAQGYAAGRFPLSQIVEFPGLGESALQTGCILQSLYDQGLVADEYADSHVLFMFATGPSVLHTRDKSIAAPDALQGLRIRNPAEIAGAILQRAGAKNVTLPAPDAYASLERGTIDGAAFPWEAMQVFGLNKLASHHTDVPIYSTIFVTTMNKRSYERLPTDLKQVIDAHSGPEWQRRAAAVFDALDTEGRRSAEQSGNEIITVEDPMADTAWGPLLQSVVDDYLQGLKAQRLPADDVYAAAKALKSTCPATAG